MVHIEKIPLNKINMSGIKERIILYGDENRCIDQLGNLVYSSKWFVGLPTMSEVVRQYNPLQKGSEVGYNIPIGGSRKWKRLWWNVTDIECDGNPVWAMVSLEEFLVWITKMASREKVVQIGMTTELPNKSERSAYPDLIPLDQ